MSSNLSMEQWTLQVAGIMGTVEYSAWLRWMHGMYDGVGYEHHIRSVGVRVTRSHVARRAPYQAHRAAGTLATDLQFLSRA